ncbi:MAG: OmpA family protein, partial [Muribaculaceae bacterium]|nr:OmpA family protein [Muribaculaceae bacterium]
MTKRQYYNSGEYYEAAGRYKDVYANADRKNFLRGNAAFRAGVCYDRLNMASRAEGQLKNAIRNGVVTDSAYYLLVRNLIRQGKFADAETQISNISVPSNFDNEISLMLASIKNNGTKTVARFKVARAGNFTTTKSEYSPMFSPGDDDRLYYTSTGQHVAGDKSRVTGMKNGDIVTVRKNEAGQWLKPESVEGGINSVGDDGVVAFTPDGRVMYFTRISQPDKHGQHMSIWKSVRRDANWCEPQIVVIGNDTDNNYGYPAISADGLWLIFSSDRPGGFGGFDLWRVPVSKPSSKPQNLGRNINTAGNEKFPTVSPDGRLLFASDGHSGFGGLDIYDGGNASVIANHLAVNLGAPINTPADDFGMTFVTDCKSGYFSSNRNDASGRDHLYKFDVIDFKTLIEIAVTDFEGVAKDDAVIRIVGDNGSDRRIPVNHSGLTSIEIKRGVKYALMASAPGCLNGHVTFEIPDTPQDEATEIYETDFVLVPVNKPVNIRNVYFDYNCADLRAEGLKNLDRLAMIMTENSMSTIEIASHTDRHGSDQYNLDLSQRRARAVTDYLELKGINKQRMTARGYGSQEPAMVDQTIADRYPQLNVGLTLDESFVKNLPDEVAVIADSLNRRTEFIIKN